MMMTPEIEEHFQRYDKLRADLATMALAYHTLPLGNAPAEVLAACAALTALLDRADGALGVLLDGLRNMLPLNKKILADNTALIDQHYTQGVAWLEERKTLEE